MEVEGGQGPYTIKYDSFPAEWKQVMNGLYAPRKSIAEDRKYPCQVRVKDRSGRQLKATVVFIARERRLAVESEIYPYEKEFDDEFYNEDGCSGKPILVFHQERAKRLRNMRNSSRQREYKVAKYGELKQLNRLASIYMEIFRIAWKWTAEADR